MSIRTRFAPSPSGFLHIGGARTALFNYLLARNRGGVFVLRIEDTDRERSTPESIEAILTGLRWLELDWDEGPFYQSERDSVYQPYVEKLLESGKAYRCTCTPEQVDEMRRTAQAQGRRPGYDGSCRDRTDVDPAQPHVVRFRTLDEGQTGLSDLVRGGVLFENSEFDDFVIRRTDGSPTYNFVVVVDDAEMEITHVVRGEDHLSNTPKQILIYQALGLPVPAFAHLPLILGPDGSRLSKRHGATSVMAYQEMGYLPAGMNNYLARLGWSHGDQEIFSRQELIRHFSLEHVGSSAGVFNPEKLEWVNFQHLKETAPEELAGLVTPLIEARRWQIPGDTAWLARVAELLRERAKTLNELVDAAYYFLEDDLAFDDKAVDKHLRKASPEVLGELRAGLDELATWEEETIEGAFQAILEKHDLKLGKLAQPVRVALTGGSVSPGIFETAAVLGKDRVLRRLDRAIGMIA
jgi:glutamyl-tRNA synthetase